jgi:hypothetical protein
MVARLRTYGSREVADAYEQFGKAVQAFYGFVFSVRTIRGQGGTGDLAKCRGRSGNHEITFGMRLRTSNGS